MTARPEGQSEKDSVKNPGRTPEEELEVRVDYTLKLLTEGRRKSEIKKIFRQRYNVTARTVENYLSRARQILLTELKAEREEHTGRSLSVYRSILSDPKAKIKDRLAAQRRIDRLLGLEAPTRVALTDPDGNTAATPTVNIAVNLSKLSTEELLIMRSIRGKLAAGTIEAAPSA